MFKRQRLQTGKNKTKQKNFQAKPQSVQRANEVSAVKRSLADLDHHGSRNINWNFSDLYQAKIKILKTKPKIFLGAM